MLPMLFEFDTWHNPPRFMLSLVAPKIIETMKSAFGQVPNTLNDEHAIRVFTNEAAIPICDEDIESALFFPHRIYASRAWVKDLYTRFIDWCQRVGWHVTPSVPPTEIPEAGPVATGASAAGSPPAVDVQSTPAPVPPQQQVTNRPTPTPNATKHKNKIVVLK